MRRVSLSLPNGTCLELEAPEHLYIPRKLERDGLAKYEPDTLAAALALTSMREGPFVDIGANIGVFSLLIAAVLGRAAFAFEPQPDAVGVLERAVKRHRLPVAISRVALSDRAGTAEFYVSSVSDTSSGLNAEFRPAKSSFEVTLGRLDDVLPSKPPSLMKIDTETTEPAVLAGATALIDTHRPPMIVEVLKNRTEDQIESFFTGRGYTWYHLNDDDRWAPQTRIVGDRTYTHMNWLFTPEPLSEPFWVELTRWRRALTA